MDNGWSSGQTDKRMDGRTDWMNGWTNGWTWEFTNRRPDKPILGFIVLEDSVTASKLIYQDQGSQDTSFDDTLCFGKPSKKGKNTDKFYFTAQTNKVA